MNRDREEAHYAEQVKQHADFDARQAEHMKTCKDCYAAHDTAHSPAYAGLSLGAACEMIEYHCRVNPCNHMYRWGMYYQYDDYVEEVQAPPAPPAPPEPTRGWFRKLKEVMKNEM